MMLVGEGLLELDEPVAGLISDLGREWVRFGERLTLRQVLSHTGGLPGGRVGEERLPGTISARGYLMSWSAELDSAGPPGVCFSYSNLGYVLAGYLIEVVTGMSWWDAVALFVLSPLGIEPAFVVSPDSPAWPAAEIAGHAVSVSTGLVTPTKQAMVRALAPAGGLALTAQDLVAFGRTHLAGSRLLTGELIGEMHRPTSGANPFGLADGWGLGFALYDTDRGRWLGHDGFAAGTSCYLRIEPSAGRVVALTTNANTGDAVWRELVADVCGSDLSTARYETVEELPPGVPLPDEYLGSYVNGDLEYDVRADAAGDACVDLNGTLWRGLRLDGSQNLAAWDPRSGRWIRLGRFLLDERTGRVAGIHVNAYFARRADRRVAAAGFGFTGKARF
jgi:CubicO group peptidase (beta-lactamase class C family)